MRDGRSMSTRRVTVTQGERTLLIVIASFHANPTSPELADPPPAGSEPRPASACCRTGCTRLPRTCDRTRVTWVEQPPPLDLRIGEAPTFLGGLPAERGALALDAPAARRRRRPAAARGAARVRQRLPAARHGVPLVPGARRGTRRSPASASITRSGSTARSASTAGTSTRRRRSPSRAIAGLVRGTIHDADGHLVASVMQEVLVRPRAERPESFGSPPVP